MSFQPDFFSNLVFPPVLHKKTEVYKKKGGGNRIIFSLLFPSSFCFDQSWMEVMRLSAYEFLRILSW